MLSIHLAARSPWIRLLAPVCAALLAACSLPIGPKGPQQVYDFGLPADGDGTHPAGHAVVVPVVAATSWLDSDAITYRLYSAPNRPMSYANSRWSMTPAELLTREVRDTLASRFDVLSTNESANQIVLRLELNEFTQVFDAPGESHVVLQFRATVVRSGKLIAQNTFRGEPPHRRRAFGLGRQSGTLGSRRTAHGPWEVAKAESF
jgi:cholesterol transport system auxiliary component